MKRLTKRMLPIFTAALALSMPAFTFAADGDQPAAKTTEAHPGGRGGMFAADPLRETMAALGDLALSPDFDLTKDQKTKIQAVRDDHKKQMDKWRADHADELKKIQSDMAELRANRGADGNREKMQAIMQSRQTLMATAPSGEDAAKQIKAVLNADQSKQLEAKEEEHKADAERMRAQFQAGGGRGNRGANTN